MCGKIMTVLLIFVVLDCSMARYNGRLHCVVGVLPTCYKRKAATYFYPPGGTEPQGRIAIQTLYLFLQLNVILNSKIDVWDKLGALRTIFTPLIYLLALTLIFCYYIFKLRIVEKTQDHHTHDFAFFSGVYARNYRDHRWR